MTDPRLAAHVPLLRYTNGEEYPAGPIEQLIALGELKRANGDVLARPPRLTLEFIAPARFAGQRRYETGEPWMAPDTIGLLGHDHVKDLASLSDELRRDVIYGEIEERFAVYWRWHQYNHVPDVMEPALIRSPNSHEGDWEPIVVEFDEMNDKPTQIGLGQHRGGQRLDWSRVELQDGHPVVYVALGTHAAYAVPTRHGLDLADASGREVLPELRSLGRWAGWTGRCGDTKGDPRWPWESTSPPMPRRQLPSTDPAAWLARLPSAPT